MKIHAKIKGKSVFLCYRDTEIPIESDAGAGVLRKVASEFGITVLQAGIALTASLKDFNQSKEPVFPLGWIRQSIFKPQVPITIKHFDFLCTKSSEIRRINSKRSLPAFCVQHGNPFPRISYALNDGFCSTNLHFIEIDGVSDAESVKKMLFKRESSIFRIKTSFSGKGLHLIVYSKCNIQSKVAYKRFIKSMRVHFQHEYPDLNFDSSTDKPVQPCYISFDTEMLARPPPCISCI